MKKNILLLILLLLSLSFCGCSDKTMPDTADPVTLTMWHVYGSQTQSPLNLLIDDFNHTVGKENGVIINVVSVTSSSAIDQALAASANHEPGAQDLPDLFTAYPRVAEIVGRNKLLDWQEYFSQQELAVFTPEFLREGYFNDRLLMLPIAKSTEAFFVNQTLFDRFSAQTGITKDCLTTFQDIFDTACAYYDWSGGQYFMQLNDYYHYAYAGMKAKGFEFIENEQLQVHQKAFEQIWNPLAKAAIYGGICLEDGYAASRWKTMEIVANTGSTADILYQPEEMIYPDNSTEPITVLTLPYPAFDLGNCCAVHRGGGLFAIKSDDERKNNAAAIFAGWITQKEQNLDFVTQAGYLPVTDEAFDLLFETRETLPLSRQNLYEAVDFMRKEYQLCALPLYKGASDVQAKFESNVKETLKSAHNQYLMRIRAGENPENVLHELIASSLETLRSYYEQETDSK